MEIKKILVVGIIFLFIGIAVAPNINSTVVKASIDNDLVEVTTQACGIKGFGNTTVKLTKQQYQNLEQYLVNFRAQLNKTTTREEAVPLFNEAVVELAEFGLLPEGMTIKQAQKLVTGAYYPNNATQTLLPQLKLSSKIFDKNTSFFMLLYGKTTNILFTRLLIEYYILLYGQIQTLIFYLVNNPFTFLIGVLLEALFYRIDFVAFIFLRGLVLLFENNPTNVRVLPSLILPYVIGFIQGVGINGVRHWEGQLLGHINLPFLGDTLKIGIVGFTGFFITSKGEDPTYLGSAICADILEI